MEEGNVGQQQNGRSHQQQQPNLPNGEAIGPASREPSVTFSTRNKCNGTGAGGYQHQPQHSTPMASKQQLPNGISAFRRHSQHQMASADSSPPSANGNGSAGGRSRPAAAGPPPLHFGGGSQFDTQSLQARRSRSFAAHHHQQFPSGGGAAFPATPNGNGGIPNGGSIEHHFQQQQQQQQAQQTAIVQQRYGSCGNLSLAGQNGGGQLVLYESHHHQQPMPAAEAVQRHSMHMLPMDMPQQMAAPIWYQPMMAAPPHPPPPPFYYTATTTLPHPAAMGAPPPTMMDYNAFKRAMKESERLEKKQRKLAMAEFGDAGFGDTCCEFCCGGSALVLWLVVSLVALGFLGFLLLAIYFV